MRRHVRIATRVAVAALVSLTACTERLVSRQSDIPIEATPTGGGGPANGGTCSVSDLLVPECGAWFGASTPSSDGRYDFTIGLREYEQLVGVQPDILHFYQRGAEPFPTDEHVSLAERPGRARSLLYFNWKPSIELTWRQVADGDADDAIDIVAESLSDYPHRVFLTVYHEPEDNVIEQPGSGMTPDDYVAMYRHVVTSLRELGVDNVVYVMGYMGFERWSSIVDDLYPGDDVVDWIAYDPYGFDRHDSFADVLDSSESADWAGFYSWATNAAPSKPIMLAEWGFDLSGRQTAAGLLAAAPTTLENDFPRIKALVYWNDRGERVDARLTQASAVGDEFVTAFSSMAADPYFNATSTDRAP